MTWSTVIEDAPKDRPFIGFGQYAYEGPKRNRGPQNYHDGTPITGRSIVHHTKYTEFEGFDWDCNDGGDYITWMKLSHWTPLLDEPEGAV